MNKNFLLSSFFGILLLTSGSLHAQPSEEEAQRKAVAKSYGMDNPSCQEMMHQLEGSCRTAGYNDPEVGSGKNPLEDCVKPILAGKKIPGVMANPRTKHSCETKKKHQHRKH